VNSSKEVTPQSGTEEVCGKPVGKPIVASGTCDKPVNHLRACSNQLTRNKNKAAKDKSRTSQRKPGGLWIKIKSKEAVEIFVSAVSAYQHVIDFCVTLALSAHRNLGDSYNRHLFSHGLRATLNGTELPQTRGR